MRRSAPSVMKGSKGARENNGNGTLLVPFVVKTCGIFVASVKAIRGKLEIEKFSRHGDVGRCNGAQRHQSHSEKRSPILLSGCREQAYGIGSRLAFGVEMNRSPLASAGPKRGLQ